MNRSRISASLCLASVAAAVAAAPTTFANVVIAQYSPTKWEYKRIQIPDVDQKRVGLPNNGSCHCVPTSLLSTLTYVANHGFPDVRPFPHNWADQSTFGEATEWLDSWGILGSTSPGGTDPVSGDDIPCGTGYSGSNLIGQDAIADAEGIIHVQMYATGAWAPTDTWLAQLSASPSHPIISMGYSRYDIIGTTPEGQWKLVAKGGGHRVTLSGLHYDQSDNSRYVLCRDPADDSDLLSQSAYLHRKITATQAIVAPVPDGDQPNVYFIRYVTLLDENLADAKTATITSAQIFWPATGHSFTETEIFPNLPLSQGFDGDPIPDPPIASPGGQLTIDIAPQMDNVELFVLTVPQLGSPVANLWSAGFGQERVLLATLSNASQLSTSRFRDLFVLANTSLLQFNPDQPDLPPSTHPLPAGSNALAIDDSSDTCCALSSSAHAIYRLKPYLAGGGTTTVPVPSNVPLGAAARLDVCPTDGGMWFCTDASDSVFGLVPNAAGGWTLKTLTRPDIAHPTCVTFDDRGRLHVVCDAGVLVFVPGRRGDWQLGNNGMFNGLPIGSTLRLARSRNNLGAPSEIADEDNIPADEYVPLGSAVASCAGDIDLNGVIDATDLARLLGAWGPCVAECSGDSNGDGVVDASDLAILLGSWGVCSD